MTIDQEQLEELCSKFDLLEYVEQDHEMIQQGDKYFTNCTLHVDDTPSLAIYPESNSYYCFSCKQGGNAINYLRTYEGLSFDEAVAKIAGSTGVTLKQKSESVILLEKLRRQSMCKDEKIEREVLESDYYTTSFADEIPNEWLEEGISAEAMKLYEIRVDHKSNRIVYPVYDSNYNLIGVKGRTRFENYKTLGLAKYMNYKKIGSLDYFTGMKQAEEYIRKSGEIIIFEGLKSCMKAWDYGYYNTVAAETSALSAPQIKLLIKMRIKNVVIAFDSDQKQIHGIDKLRSMTNVYVVRDYRHLLGEKMSPVDAGKEVWEKLYSERRKA